MIPVTDHDTQKEKEIYYKQTRQIGIASIAIFTSMSWTGYFTIRQKLHLFEEYYSSINHMAQNVVNGKHSCIYQRVIDRS